MSATQILKPVCQCVCVGGKRVIKTVLRLRLAWEGCVFGGGGCNSLLSAHPTVTPQSTRPAGYLTSARHNVWPAEPECLKCPASSISSASCSSLGTWGPAWFHHLMKCFWIWALALSNSKAVTWNICPESELPNERLGPGQLHVCSRPAQNVSTCRRNFKMSVFT